MRTTSRRSFLKMLGVAAAAPVVIAKGMCSHVSAPRTVRTTTANPPAMQFDPKNYMGDLEWIDSANKAFAGHAPLFQAEIVAHMQRTNPFLQLFDERA